MADMAEEPQQLIKNRHQAAVEKVRAVLVKDPAYAAITAAETGERLKNCTAIWRKTVDTPDRSWVVDVGLPPLFPDEVPIAFLPAGNEAYLKNPHIEQDGFICTIPDSAATDSDDPVGLVHYVFNDCQQILQGTGPNDFQDEFYSYWNHSAPKQERELVIIDPAERLTTPFQAVFSEKYIYVASNISQINHWVANRTGEASAFKSDDNGIVIKLDSPLIPEKYPNTVSELVTLADTFDKAAGHRIKSLLASSAKSGLVLLVQAQGQGVAMGAVIFNGLGLSRINSVKLVRGFRPGTVPSDLLYRRAHDEIRSKRVIRTSVERVDHQWIHSRGGDGSDLSKKSVLIIGCGSLGGHVAYLLSRAGIGRLTLTDNDVLAWDNLGRHILGAESIGTFKAKELARVLARQMPHLDIVGIPKDWRDALNENPNLFAEKDLIVSTVAEWRCERPLNGLIRNAEMPPLLFGWVEPHAVAGHCLTIAGDGGCLECGANEYGQFLDAVAQYENTPLAKEPGGCTYYQNYGPIALLPIASMVAASVVEALLHRPTASSLKTWIGSQDHFSKVRAALTDVWMATVEKGGHSREYRKNWSKSTSCRVCTREH